MMGIENRRTLENLMRIPPKIALKVVGNECVQIHRTSKTGKICNRRTN